MLMKNMDGETIAISEWALHSIKPLLTIITPTYKRPIGLKMCRASVAGQHESERIQHLIVPDDVGKGVGGAFRDLPLVHDRIEGDYVFILSDDDVLIYPAVVRLVERTVGMHDPDIIMVKQYYGGHIGRVLPDANCWGFPPICGHVTLSNWIVRASWHKAIPYGDRYEGDYDFIAAAWQRNPRVAWADVVLSATQDGGHHGQPE